MKYSQFLILILVLFLASCATIFKGSTADIKVNSAPSNADIIVNGIDKGTTPQTLQLDRDQDYTLTIQKDGYEDVKMEVTKKFDFATTILGNIVTFPVLGIIVDFATGAAYSLTPYDLQANLESMESAGLISEIPEQKEGEITVVMLTKKQWQKIQQ